MPRGYTRSVCACVCVCVCVCVCQCIQDSGKALAEAAAQEQSRLSDDLASARRKVAELDSDKKEMSAEIRKLKTIMSDLQVGGQGGAWALPLCVCVSLCVCASAPPVHSCRSCRLHTALVA